MRSLGSPSTRELVASVVIVAVLAGACGAPASPTPITANPMRLATGTGHVVGSFGDSIEPGTAVSWIVDVANDADQPAVIDAYDLVGASAGLRVLGAAGIYYEPGLSLGQLAPVTEQTRLAVAARPLIGWSFRPTTSTNAIARQSLVFVVEADTPGDYSLNSIILHYHIGGQSFQTQLAASLELCVGATVAAGSTCPFPPASQGA